MSDSSELVIGSDRAIALQASIQKALSEKGYSAEDDTVMAEYITIMLINQKTKDQVTSELTELIGTDYDETFTDWLFIERDNPDLAAAQDGPYVEVQPIPVQNHANHGDASRTFGGGRSQPPPARPLHQQAISSISASQPGTVLKRQRSSSPGSGSSKRHLPDRPRAMRDDGTPIQAGPPRPGRLLDRVGPRQNGGGPRQVPNNMHHPPPMMPPMNGGFPPGMDPTAMAMMQQQGFNPAMMGAPGFPNGLEATMMALQQFGQLAMQMGLVGGPMMTPGMPGPAVPFNGPPQGAHRPNNPHNAQGQQQNTGVPASMPAIAAPTPTQHAPAVPLDIPTRPLSPTLCKFVANCNNPTCRYSHPSPVATMESGVVLSTEPCPKGISCEDPDCLNAHVSKAAKNPGNAAQSAPTTQPKPTKIAAPTSALPIVCKFDANCTRPNCPYQHPSRLQTKGKPAQSNVPCRFGAACTRADCTFAHPPGRVLPSQFSRGLDPTAPSFVSSKPAVESRNRTVDFRGARTGADTGPTVAESSSGQPAAQASTPVDQKAPLVETA